MIGINGDEDDQDYRLFCTELLLCGKFVNRTLQDL